MTYYGGAYTAFIAIEFSVFDGLISKIDSTYGDKGALLTFLDSNSVTRPYLD
jgi:hypothetical protein